MEKLRDKPFPAQITTGPEEAAAVAGVMATGKLSHYRGNYTEFFTGGPKVREFEAALSRYVRSKNAIAINSCTSALQIACGAIGLKPGDEVIVTPWSMSCSASAPLLYGATPVFADIEHDYFCLDLEDVIEKTTDRTRAIIAVSLFGQPFNPAIREFADSRGIIVIEDAAQAIGSTTDQYGVKMAGTLGHIGCFSFTQGKHITAGEGGAIVTDNEYFAGRCRLLRNHSESVIHDIAAAVQPNPLGDVEPVNRNFALSHCVSDVGFNMRMTEVAAAILIEQLKKLPDFVQLRKHNAMRLGTIFAQYPEIFSLPKIRSGCIHSFYVYALNVHLESFRGVFDPNRRIADRLNELLPGEDGRPDKPMFGAGYIQPLNEFPLFEEFAQPTPDTVRGLYDSETIVTTLVGMPLDDDDFSLIERAVDIVVREVIA